MYMCMYVLYIYTHTKRETLYMCIHHIYTHTRICICVCVYIYTPSLSTHTYYHVCPVYQLSVPLVLCLILDKYWFSVA